MIRRMYLCGPRKRQKRDITIYWVTDLHLDGAFEANPVNPPYDPRWEVEQGSYRLGKFVDDVAAASPDFVLCTGDIVDAPSTPDDYTNIFMPRWESITVPKALTIGNHDLARGQSVITAAESLGRGNSPWLGGSPFNEVTSLVVGDVSVRIIMLDSNIDSTGHRNMSVGKLQPDGLDWLSDVTRDAQEDIVIIGMHHGPGTVDFDEGHSDLFFDILHSNVPKNRTVFVLYGHRHHRQRALVTYSRDGIVAINGTCLVDFDTGRYNVLKIDRNGSWSVSNPETGRRPQ